MKYKIYRKTEHGLGLWGIVENESIAFIIETALKQTLNWELVHKPSDDVVTDDKLDELAKDSWENLRKFASAPHVVEGWDNYIFGFRNGYKTAKEK